MKKLAAFILLLPLLLCACGKTPEVYDSSKAQIVCTCFPAYDFAREIAGDTAQLRLLIKPGAEVHSFEPTPKDMARILDCDLFILNGGESEEWTEELPLDGLRAVRMMDCVMALEESGEGIYKAEDEEEPELDEHVWTSPLNAVLICNEICAELCDAFPENSELYRKNLAAYTEKLLSLDSRLRDIAANASRDTLVFADRFPMRYFTAEYGLRYFAAYPGCSSQTEPSARTVAYLIDRVREENIPAVLYMEFSNEKMADIICEETGCIKLPFYSAHSVAAEQLDAGVTYTDLMEININSLKEALY